MKTSKDIIIRLIDQDIIDGEEAYVLLNDILRIEMIDAYKVLNEGKQSYQVVQSPWVDQLVRTK